MYQMKICIEMERLPLSMLLLLSCWLERTDIYSVCYINDEYSIYYFCFIMKKLTYRFFFSREIITQDFKTVSFNVRLVLYRPIFSVTVTFV